jgi:hypothetical protein
MLSSGPKSYYDDYVRKKDTERAFAKPPALLTDRNAYINFLEVQLERVSAACFSAHGHETRFNDMQGLIVSLDERCNNTSRFIALAQQSTEEIRSEFNQRVELEANVTKGLRTEVKKSFELLSLKVAHVEKVIALLPQIDGKLNAMDKRLGEYESKQRGIELECRTSSKLLHERIEKLDSEKDELYALLESTRASVSRMTFDVEENTSRVNNYIAGVEARITQTVQGNKEDTIREMIALQAKSSNQYDEVRKLVEQRDLEMLTMTRKHHKFIQDEIEEAKRKWAQDLETLSDHLQTEAQRKVEKVQHNLTTSLQEMRTAQNHQAAMVCDIEDSFLKQLHEVQERVQDITMIQQNVEEKLSTTNKSFEGRLQDLQTTLNNTSMRIAQQTGPQWPPQGFFPPSQSQDAPFGGVSYMQESGFVVPPGGAPLSPVPRNASDGSFNIHEYPQQGAANAPPGLRDKINSVHSNYHVQAQSRGLANIPAPPSPLSMRSQDLQGSSVCQQSVRPAATSPGNSHFNSRSNSRAGTVSRRFAQSKTRSRSASPGSVSKATEKAGTTSGPTTKVRKKRSDSAAEVIQKFLDIYDADQQDISKR